MPYITNMSDIPDELAQIVIALILLGFAKQDCVLKAKSQLNIQRKLTEDEKLRLAYKIQLRFPQMEISDLMYSINLAESMPGYSSGGTLPDGTIPDVILPNTIPNDTIPNGESKTGGKSYLYFALGLGLILLLGFRK
jgi:hypothetical protein